MNYLEYRNQMIGKRVNFDGKFGYQCVDLIKDYLSKVYWIKVGKWGNAKDYWTNKYKIFNWWRLKLWTDDLKQGDIIISTKSKYWHIAIIDWWEMVLEQNWWGKKYKSGLWPNTIRLHQYPLSFRTWVWRYDDWSMI